MISSLFWIVPISALMALLFAWIFYKGMKVQEEGTDKMKEIAEYVREGAMAYLKSQYTVVGKIFIILVVLLAILAYIGVQNPFVPVAFLTGGFFSGLCGYLGMKTATFASNRTAWAASKSLNKGLQVALRSGAVMGLVVVGFALLDIAAWFIFLTKVVFTPEHMVSGLNFLGLTFVPQGIDEHQKFVEITATMITFGMGASTQALFARVGGGIFTKAADVGADLVGKVEAGIPEDDPRNPATIADNVGDNVGDVAGMGADLFGSYVATVLATMVLGQETQAPDDSFSGMSPILLPMMIAGTGILFSIIATFFVRISENASISTGPVQKALNMGNWGSIVLTALASIGLVYYILPETMVLRGIEFTKWGVLGAIGVGLAVGTLMSMITEYYTAIGKRPVMSIIRQSSTGHATNVIGGLAVGMESTCLPILVLAGGIWGSYACAGLYGVAIAAAGMMATTAMQLAIDAFGPIADNAGGIAEMSELPKEVREKTDVLDAVGNTTAATGKGFAIASAALTSLALFAAFVGVAGISGIDIYKAKVLAALFVGAMIPLSL